MKIMLEYGVKDITVPLGQTVRGLRYYELLKIEELLHLEIKL